ncbi:hypothetical protein SAMD00019534_086560 [Acytostelium subglobosum LB1]|uniref:hypothetical protein n=1 Tax=Acytostelium subglobosum LB1 TaxID=1410327 RepID=UPI0006447D91|nr:hypothetical protein SAMD00019534_086560 [Acytostelium subglobosum LB1]GAM25481.1 hypothetical protein SAMD00019534_086560 [Acytostelium subglobosum LB1]|eukprot:XP_012751467.1 hypothetical protein SAMD00019534_086560 [Acytostelium subglobosum LB1]
MNNNSIIEDCPSCLITVTDGAMVNGILSMKSIFLGNATIYGTIKPQSASDFLATQSNALESGSTLIVIDDSISWSPSNIQASISPNISIAFNSATSITIVDIPCFSYDFSASTAVVSLSSTLGNT